LTSTVGKSAKYVVTAIATYFILFSDSWIPMYYVLGGVLNASMGKLLKSILKQPRPKGSPKKGLMSLTSIFFGLNFKLFNRLWFTIVTFSVNILFRSSNFCLSVQALA
jgi:hypothetical protein